MRFKGCSFDIEWMCCETCTFFFALGWIEAHFIRFPKKEKKCWCDDIDCAYVCTTNQNGNIMRNCLRLICYSALYAMAFRPEMRYSKKKHLNRLLCSKCEHDSNKSNRICTCIDNLFVASVALNEWKWKNKEKHIHIHFASVIHIFDMKYSIPFRQRTELILTRNEFHPIHNVLHLRHFVQFPLCEQWRKTIEI